MRLNLRPAGALVLGLASAASPAAKEWPIHDLTRPQPPIVEPGTAGTAEQPGRPPSDAVVLFDGKDLSAWMATKGDGPAGWKVENGYMEVVKGAGGIHTRKAFGDCQLHVEFMAPAPPKGAGQERGNSGVFFMGGRYEVQVLDSHGNTTYPDGQAGALYGQTPPLVNASRPPGQWQVYDIVFEAPRFDGEGKVTRPARATVFHNGVVVQNATELTGPTTHKVRTPYSAHEGRLPIALQDHGDPVRFRNLWVRELGERP